MKKSNDAFTLIEMLISLSIICILAALTFPMLNFFLHQSDDEIVKEELLNTIARAKAEAEVRHVPIAVCKTKNQKSCGGSWRDGLLIFLDENRNGVLDRPEQIISASKSPFSHGSLHWRSYPLYRDYLLFLPMRKLGNGNGTFWYCRASSPIWAIFISKSGRTRVAYPDQDGVIKDGPEKPLSCI